MNRFKPRTRAVAQSKSLAETRARAVKALFLVLTALGFVLLLQGSASAQDASAVPGLDTDALEMQQAQRQADDNVTQLDQALQQARLALTQCANSESQTLAGINGQAAEAKAGAVGDIASSTFSGLTQSVFGDAAKQGKAATASLSTARSSARDLVSSVPPPSAGGTAISQTQMLDNNGAVNITAFTAAWQQACAGKVNTQSAPTVPGGPAVINNAATECNTEKNAAIQEARSVNKDVAQALANQAGADGISEAVTGAGVSALGGVVGAGFKLHASAVGQKAQKKGAALNRDMCEQQAKLQMQAAQTALETAKIRRDQDLMNLKLQQAARKALTTGGVDVASTGTAGPGVPFPAGGLGRAPASNKPDGSSPAASGGGGGGGGGGPGSAGADKLPWTFGNGQEDGVDRTGLPTQPSAAQFQAEGGGGGGGGGGFGFEQGFDAGAPGAAGLAGAVGADGQGGELLLGDGGLNILMSRARRRYANHAADLVRSLDLKELAKKVQAGPSPASLKNQL